MIKLYQVKTRQRSPRPFTAGFTTVDGKVYATAPLLRKTLMGKDEKKAIEICENMYCEVTLVEEIL
jgi:hypothetical protein